jgi:alkylhydroperoxidase family enzyme
VPNSWLDLPDAPTLLEAAAALRPAYGAALDQVVAAVWEQEVIDVATLELCRIRIGQLLGAAPVATRVDPELAAALPRWPVDERFDARLRTVLGFAEQVLFDAQDVSDEQAREVIDVVGEDGLLVLTYACGIFETTQRAELILAAGGDARSTGGAGSTAS